MDVRELKSLYSRYLKGECTTQEKEIMEEVIREMESQDFPIDQDRFDQIAEPRLQHLLDDIQQYEERLFRKPRRLRLWWATAAASIVIIATVAFLLNRNDDTTPQQQTETQLTDVDPGSNKAILTLASGKKIDLNGAAAGKIAQQAGAQIMKSGSGEVTYAPQSTSEETAVTNNIATPRAGQYTLTLSDGTKVMLNAASSITFPCSFKGSSNRMVEITGECYFEVAHNARQPFIVRTGSQRIEVLGTHFNVNAYADEVAITTTLVEGKVKVSSEKGAQTLQPGHMAINRNGVISSKAVDAQQAVAWTTGWVYFQQGDLRALMRQISRWYDVDIRYEGELPSSAFDVAAVSRNWSLSKLTNLLTKIGVQTKIVKSSSGSVTLVVLAN